MSVHNADVAAVFDEIADLLEIQGANPFRIRAYRNAARTIQSLGREVRLLVETGRDLTELPGVGKDLAGKIEEIVRTGTCAALDELHHKLPPSLGALLKVPGLGPKRVHVLFDELNVRTPEELYEAAHAGRIREQRGFGEKTEAHILQALEQHVTKKLRFPLAVAAQYAEPLAAMLRTVPGVREVVLAGSYRRAKETVGDLDILVTADPDSMVIDRFVHYDDVREVTAQGTTRAGVVLRGGLQVDLRVVEPQSLGAAMHYFTGSKAHNIAVRRLAQQRGLKLNEYGVFKGRTRVAGESEASVFGAVDLSFIPPELRENRGEVEAARAGALPKLIERKDIRGDLHAHTQATDGHNTLEEMARAARACGLEYLAITEHSRHLAMAKGFDPTRLREQMDAIDRLNARLEGITLLKGIEVDILEDGALDLPDRVLSSLDLVVGAVHGHFNLSRAKQTARILRAIDHPHFSVLAHPTGRLLDSRAPYEVDMLKILRAARERGCFIELNANPLRLDLSEIHCQMARDEGVLVALSTDAHSTLDFDSLRYGIGQARRGWLTKEDVLTTRSLAELKPLLQRTM